MKTADNRKLYIFTAKHSGWQKRLYFDGPSGEKGEALYKELLQRIEPLGEASTDLPDFIVRIRKMFLENSFYPSEK
jgi:hypothetical protein